MSHLGNPTRGLEADESKKTLEESSVRGAFMGLSIPDGVTDAPGNLESQMPPLCLPQASQHPETKKQLNILLLGETGVGKSTMINAFANYITFENMEEAMSSNRDLVALLPMVITHMDVRTYETHTITFGEEDPNEYHKGGQAVTQEPRSYTFPMSEDLTVHIIDTPGIGDPRGVEQDQINFNRMLNYLSNYDVIHGICILLKPNTARLSITFRFCIQELLCHLHKSASANIVFLFTHARGAYYTPGDTVVPLKALLQQVQHESPQVVIPVNENTVYCVDNEAFRMVLPSKKGFSFTDRDVKTFSESWSRSTEECRRMLDHFTSIKPHIVSETVSLHHAVCLLKNLQEPMQAVSSNLTENMELLIKKQEELQKFKGDVNELKVKIEIQQLELKAEGYTDGAATVCTSRGCCKDIVMEDTGEVETKYKICHQPCNLASNASFGDKATWFCSIFSFFGKCKYCGCPLGSHRRITYVPHVVARKRALKNAVTEQVEAGNELEACKMQVKVVQQLYLELKEERNAIMEAAARFAFFFKNNAIVTYNDIMKAYVDQQIAIEKDQAGVKRLQEFQKSYELERQKVEELAAAGKGGDCSTEGMMRTARSLYKLKHAGAKLHELVEVVMSVEHHTAKLHNKACPFPSTSHFAKLKRRWR